MNTAAGVRSAINRLMIHYTPAETLRALVDLGVVERPRPEQVATAVELLTRGNVSWARFLDAAGNPTTAEYVDPKRLEAVGDALRARWPSGKSMPARTPREATAPAPGPAPATRPEPRQPGPARAPQAHMTFPASAITAFSHPFREADGTQRVVERFRVTIPQGTKVNGIDVGGCVFFCRATDHAKRQLLNAQPVVISVRSDRLLALHGKVGIDSVNPWSLATAAKRYNQAHGVTRDTAATAQGGPQPRAAAKGTTRPQQAPRRA